MEPIYATINAYQWTNTIHLLFAEITLAFCIAPSWLMYHTDSMIVLETEFAIQLFRVYCGHLQVREPL